MLMISISYDLIRLSIDTLISPIVIYIYIEIAWYITRLLYTGGVMAYIPYIQHPGYYISRRIVCLGHVKLNRTSPALYGNGYVVMHSRASLTRSRGNIYHVARGRCDVIYPGYRCIDYAYTHTRLAMLL